MKRRAGILARSMILTFLLTLLLGSLVVHAEDEVKKPEINFTNYTVNIGDEDDVLQLKMENLGDKKPRWISYNVNVARVDQEGYVTPLRKGKAIISSGIGFPRKICVVTVVDPSVKLNKTAATLYRSANPDTPGNKITLTAKVNGATKNAKDVVWRSSDTRVATVEMDEKGKCVVTAVDGADGKAGTAEITARVNGRTASCKISVVESAISLDVNKMQLSTKGAGSSIKLLPTIVGSKKAVTWTSSAPTVATVKGGKVTGKTAGTATVTATANGVKTTCEVTVVDQLISFSEEKVLLYVAKNASGETTGETKELKTNAAKTDKITWTSDNEKVVTVEGQTKGKTQVAKITAVGAGTAVITATCNDKTDTCVVEVKNTDTSIIEDDVHLKTKGEAKTYTLNYNIVGRSKNAVWKSLNTKVLSVSKGKITAKKAGSAIVTVKANGVEDKVRVIVTEYAPTIALNQKEYTLYTKGTGNTVALKAAIDGANKNVKWYSNNSKVAAVNTSGKVTAKGEGSALITATANGVTAKCWVNVKTPKILLEKNALMIKPGQKVNLYDYASIEVIGAKQSVTYKSTNTKAATVNGKGLVTGKKAGEKTTITIKANGVEENCEVVVSTCETHTFGAPETLRAATCEESGLISKTCSECGGKEQEVISPLGHAFGKWTVVAKATENAAGLEKQVCTREGCNEENIRIIPAKNKGESAYGYILAWEDDFDGETLDRNSWNVELHDPGWVNSELQSYVDSTDNIYVKDGNLVIQAIKDGDKYTSGRINTQNKEYGNYKYGKFEVRAKVPSGKGFLPAFWMMPADESYYGQWPKCGEIDVMEVMGQETNKVYSTLHFGEPHTEQQGTYTLPSGDFSTDFHVYACEWDPGEFRFYVDGILFYKVNDWFSQKPGFGKVAYPAPYDQPFYMILNLAVGGSWVGNPDETTEFGDNAQLVVDYVRVYQKDEYDTDVERPDTEVQLRDPDATGNYIINGDFAKIERLPNGENWKLLLAEGGEAAAEIKDNELHITTTNEGAVNYSVQVVQADLPIEKDCKYKLSYDAYADKARTMVTNVTAPDRGYSRYLADTTVNLTTEKKNFEHTFDMKSDSDANGRVEFNLGKQGSTATVHITNVRLEKVGEVEEDVKGILPDGNYVYNGSFDEGEEAGRLRLAYWDWDIEKCKGASVSVTSDAKRELKVVVPDTVSALDDVVVYQKPIAIKGGKTYVLSFDAYADQAKTIKTTIAGETFESALTTEKKEYRYELNTAAELNSSELRFLLGASGTTYIDNVSIREDGLIVNGDFSNGMTGFEVYVNDAAKVSGYIVDSLNAEKNPAFSIDIEDTGKPEDYYIQLKQNNIKLEKDKWYKLSFDAKSTLDRKIMYALQRDGIKHKTADGKEDWTSYSGSQTADLTKGYQTFSYTFKMTEGTDPGTILSITMGSVGGTQITTKHTVVIDNITLEETDPVEIPPVVEGEEMIANGDFSEGDAHWENAVTAPGAADVSFADGKATYKITNVGEKDWHIQLKHKELLTLEKGAEYAVKLKIKSTEARTVKYAFLNPGYKWYGGDDLSLTAGEVKEVNTTLKVSEDTSDQITFLISMGLVGTTTPASTIEIDDISVKKIGGTGGEKPDKPAAIGTELIVNGDFAKGEEKWTAGFYASEGKEPPKGKATFTDKKARYEITDAGAEDWNVQLKQEGLKMEKDATYKVNFKIGSSINRKVNLAIMGAENAWCGGSTIELTANKLKSYSQIVTLNENYVSGTLAFQISMGNYKENETSWTKLDSHAIEISDVSVTKVEAGTKADEVTEKEETITPPDGSGEKPNDPEDPDQPDVPIEGNMIENGNFSDGETGWTKEIGGTAAATVDFSKGKAVYTITNVGSNDWDIKLKQTKVLTLEKGAKYKVNFNIKSSADRTVKYSFMAPGNDWYDGEDLKLTADEENGVNYEFTVDKDTCEEIVFAISMGKIENKETPISTIEIDNVSVVKVGGTGGDGGGEQDGDNLIQNGKFEKWEDNWATGFYSSEGETAPQGNADLTHGMARYEITNAGAKDWNVQLKQVGLDMEKGASYKVNLKIGSSINRDVKLVFQDTSDGVHGEEIISLEANKLKSVSRIVKLSNDFEGALAFQISMGNYEEGDEKITTKLLPHAIEISDISVTKVIAGATADVETATDVTIAPPAENIINDGDFTGDGSAWVDYYAANGTVAKRTFTNNKVRYEITNGGENIWDIVLKQADLEMETGASYKVNFKIGSSIDRNVTLQFQDTDYKGHGNATISLKANKLKSVSQIVTLDDIAFTGKLAFQLSLGQTGSPSLAPHAIEISDISVTKVEAGTKADKETEKDTTITPPTASGSEVNAKKDTETETLAPASISDDETDDGSGAVVEEEEDDQDPEDQNTDDPSDNEDANPADQNKSGDKPEEGNAETSDDSGKAQTTEN